MTEEHLDAFSRAVIQVFKGVKVKDRESRLVRYPVSTFFVPLPTCPASFWQASPQ